MIRGYLIAESIKPGSSLEGIPMTLTKIVRRRQKNASTDQPSIWTTIDFETAASAEHLADALAAVLDDAPSVWYSDFTSGEERFVVYPKRVFRYRRDDALGRREAWSYGQSLGVPPSQLDWEY
jgi:hypothetical protein